MRDTLALRVAAIVAATSSFVAPALAQWVQESPATSPTARVAAAMDFFPLNGGLVMFGGSAGITLSNQTWTYNGVDWTLLTPATSPSGRFGANLVTDYSRGVAVLYGGLATNISIPPPVSETWEWDGTTWTQRTPATNPGARYRYGSCFDSLTNKVVMFGGVTSQLGFTNNQTWEYDGTNWALRTTTGNPGGLDRPAMCFDPAIGKAVLFGGSNGSTLSSQTWLYDGVLGTWTQVATSGAHPSARNAAQMVYDSVHGVCVLTGGQDTSGVLGDTWTFDGAKWAPLATTSPTIRDHVFAFLPTTSQAVRFAGFVAAPNTTTNETWSIGTAPYGGGCAGTNGTPTLGATTALQFGANWTLDIGNLNPAINVAFLVLGLSHVPGIDLSLLGMPGCAAYASPDLLLTVVGTAGTATWTWPTVSAPLGASLYCQALCVDPAVNAFGATLSNGVYATIDS